MANDPSIAEAKRFIWDGEDLATLGQLFNGAVAAADAGRAREFYDAYAATNDHAAENLGYLFGYGDAETRRKLYAAFNLTHPIFGGTP